MTVGLCFLFTWSLCFLFVRCCCFSSCFLFPSSMCASAREPIGIRTHDELCTVWRGHIDQVREALPCRQCACSVADLWHMAVYGCVWPCIDSPWDSNSSSQSWEAVACVRCVSKCQAWTLSVMPAICHLPSAVGCRLSIVGCWLLAVCYRPSTARTR